MRMLAGPLLAERTTLRLGGRAQAEIALDSPDDAFALPEALAKLGAAPWPLGKGSNVLADSGDLPVAILTVGMKRSPDVLGRGERGMCVRIEAGGALQRILGELAGMGLSGLEGLSGVPGTFGGAVAGNAGAHGSCVGDRLVRALVFSPDAGTRWVERDGCTVAYRSFGIDPAPAWFIVLAAELELDVDEPIDIYARMKANFAKKKAVQPIWSKTCGCAFKNPSGESAGRLLDKAGLRGFQLGGMEFSAMHANFLVNTGTGTSEQALELLDLAEARVREQFGIRLEREVRRIACR